MPEGDTLHKVALALRPLLLGHRLRAARIAHAPAPLLVGHPVAGVEVHGKHLVFALGADGDGWRLRVHLGMHGSWHRYTPGERWRRPARQAQVCLEVEGHQVVCFNPQDVELWASRGPSEVGRLEALGPDLIAATVDFDEVVARAGRLASASTLLIDLLLDQRIAAGIGNVYKCELMHIFALAPSTRRAAIDDARLVEIFRAARRLMQQNLGDWRRTTTYDRRAGRDPARPRLFVYGRAGAACLRCGGAIRRARLGRTRRSTYWCERCQSPGAGPGAP